MNRFSFKARLIALVSVLLGFLLLAVAANVVRSNESNRQFASLYQDRVLPLMQLKQIADGYRVAVVDTTQKVRDGLMKAEDGGQLLKVARARMAQDWQAYMATELLPQERVLAERLAQQIATAQPQVDTLQGLLDRKEVQNLWLFASSELYPVIDPLLMALNELSALQAETVKLAYEENQRAFEGMVARNLAGFAVAMGLGVLAAWLTIRQVTSGLRSAVEVAEQVAAGDLTARLEERGKDEVAALMGALKRMNHGLTGIVSSVRSSADAIATGSREIANGNADLSQRTETQASNLEETAASMEQLTAAVRQNADTAKEANRVAAQAAQAASAGGEKMQQVVRTMEAIDASSRRISDIIGTIDSIAFQTNILALNAAVEAARAGEQGRGFAVVASEVRNLAQRSAEAAKEIKQLIGESVATVRDGSALVTETGAGMAAIVQQVQRVNELISEISAASGEQTEGITQVGAAVMQLDQVTQQNAALVEQSAAAADSLQQQAVGLADLVARFRLTGTDVVPA